MSINKTVLWAATVVMGFAAGYYLAFTKVSSPNTVNTDLGQLQTNNANLPTPVNSSVSAGTKPQTRLSVDSNKTTNNEPNGAPADINVNDIIVMLKNDLSNDEGETSDYAQLAKAWSLISTLDEGQLFDALTILRGDLDKLENRELVSMLLSEYARFAPTQAIALIEQNISELGKKSFYARKVLAQWSKQDAYAAFNWFEQNQTVYQRFSNSFVSDVFKGLAANDVYDAIDKLNNLNTDRNTARRAVNAIAANMSGSNTDFAALLEHAHLQNNEQINKAIVGEWARKDPYAAIEWLDNQNLNDEGMQHTVLNSWMYSAGDNIAAAADWYMQQGLSNNSDKRLNNIMQGFAYANPEAGLQWLNGTSLVDKQNALVNLITSSAGINPDFAMKHIPMIENEADQLSASRRLYRSLNYNNPQKAQQFAESSPFKQELLQSTNQNRGG